VAVENARLYTDLAQRARELEAVHAVAAAVNRPGELDQILEEGLKRALAVIGLEMGAIALKEPQSGMLALRSHQGMSNGFVEWLQERLRQKSLEARPEGQDQDLDIDEIPPESPRIPTWLQEDGIRLSVDVPLFAEGELTVGPEQAEAVDNLIFSVGDPAAFHRMLADLNLLVILSWLPGDEEDLQGIMTTGRPIIIFEGRGMPREMVHGETGLCVSREAPTALSRNVKEIVQSREMGSKLAQNARRVVLEKYSREAMARRLIQEYENLARRRGISLFPLSK
jgi:hypothetical protein